MDWRLCNKEGEFIQEVNCQYDSCDIARWDHNAKKIIIDFSTKTATIIEKDDEIE